MMSGIAGDHNPHKVGQTTSWNGTRSWCKSRIERNINLNLQSLMASEIKRTSSQQGKNVATTKGKTGVKRLAQTLLRKPVEKTVLNQKLSTSMERR
jgi:hypothetical protein